ncbi:MAG: hypothetical protein AVDCRST_MAG83-3148, partial [uncultured Arthrobacter sp.]
VRCKRYGSLSDPNPAGRRTAARAHRPDARRRQLRSAGPGLTDCGPGGSLAAGIRLAGLRLRGVHPAAAGFPADDRPDPWRGHHAPQEL